MVGFRVMGLETNELGANLINSEMYVKNQVMAFNERTSVHGGTRRGAGRKPASTPKTRARRIDPTEPRRIRKPKNDENLRVLSLTEEQAYWRKALVNAAEAATVDTDKAKVMLASSSTLMDGLKAISELRRGRAYVAAPPSNSNDTELASLLRGLSPADVKRQRKRTSTTADTSTREQTSDPSTQKDEG